MKRLRTNPLPPRVTQIRTLEESRIAAINVRFASISQMHSYPIAANVLAHVRRFFKLDSVNELRAGILHLRDCVRYAAELLISLRLLKVERHQLQLDIVYDYVSSHASEYGFKHLAGRESDLSFVAYLIVGSELQSSSWLLDLQTGTDNMMGQFLKLYDQIHSNKNNYKISYERDKSELKVILEGHEEGQYYVPQSDTLMPLSKIAYPSSSRESTVHLVSGFKETEGDKIKAVLLPYEQALANEAAVYSLADIKFVDHVFSLLMDIDIWNFFITPRKEATPESNNARSEGLKVFAGYLQSLLLYPHTFRYEMFRESYIRLEKWHGSLPAVPAEVVENYAKYVKKYDFLGASADAVNLYTQFDTTNDPNLEVEIYVQFKEMLTMYGCEDELTKLEAIPKQSVIKIDKLTELEDKTLDQVLLSFPLKQYALAETIATRLIEKDKFVTVTKAVYNFLNGGYSRYYADAIVRALDALNFRAHLPLHGFISGSKFFDKGFLPRFTTGSIGMRYGAPYATAENDYALRDKERNTIGVASKLYDTYSKNVVAIDLDVAAALRTSYSREWKSYYPATLARGEHRIDRAIYKVSPLEVEHMFESISGLNFISIKRELSNDEIAKIWATVLSSFCLLYRKSPKADKATLIIGEGMPYGTSYEELATTQSFDEKIDFIAIPKTELFFAILKKFPLPGRSLAIANVAPGEPYYYFKGNGSNVDVDRLVTSESMQQFCLRPILMMEPSVIKNYLFDRFYVYSNDTLYIQISAKASFDSVLNSNEVVKVPISEKSWPGEKAALYLKYITFPGYGNTTVKAASSTEESSEVTKLIKEMETEMKKAHEETPIQNANASSSSDQVSETDIAKEFNEKNDDGKAAEAKKKSEKKDKVKPFAESANSEAAGIEVGRFIDPKTKKEIIVIAKEGEDAETAIKRVKAAHGVK